MTRRHPGDKRALAALLLLSCLLGAGLLALQREYPDLMVRRLSLLGDSPIAQSPANAPGSGQPTAGQPNIPPPPESRFAVIVLRPLFTPGRRPPDQPASPADTTAGGPPTGLLVTGIVMAGGDSVAIIEPERPGRQAEAALVARIGDSVRGWTIEAIEPGLVVLVRDGARHEMPLIDEDNPRRRAAPRRAPAPNQLRPAPLPGQPRQTPATPRPQRQPQPPAQKIPKTVP
jgi:hypothetical protein